MHQWVTVHILLGERVGAPYPFNAARNTAIEPLLPGKYAHEASGTSVVPWFALLDADGLLSMNSNSLARLIARVTTPGVPWGGQGGEKPSFQLEEGEEEGDEGELLESEGGGGSCEGADSPLPVKCGVKGWDGIRWATHPTVTRQALAASRCPHYFEPHSTLFLLASFDPAQKLSREEAEAVMQTILTTTTTTPPTEGDKTRKRKKSGSGVGAHAALVTALEKGVVTHQAHSYPDSYIGMAHWGAWKRRGGVCGPMPTHYSYVFEPYFLAKATAAFPEFDEWYRGAGWDKNSFFLQVTTTTTTTDATIKQQQQHKRGAQKPYSLVLLPTVFILNRQPGKHASAVSSPSKKETIQKQGGALRAQAVAAAFTTTTANRPSNSEKFWGWCKAHGLTCHSRCTVTSPAAAAGQGTPPPADSRTVIDYAAEERLAEAEKSHAAAMVSYRCPVPPVAHVRVLPACLCPHAGIPTCN